MTTSPFGKTLRVYSSCRTTGACAQTADVADAIAANARRATRRIERRERRMRSRNGGACRVVNVLRRSGTNAILALCSWDGPEARLLSNPLVARRAVAQIGDMHRVPWTFGRVRAASLIGCAAVIVSHPVHGQSTSTDSTGSIVGFVVTKEGGVPLGYSTVSIAALSRERFTSADGKFTLGDLPAGPLQLRVRHLGYSPVDLSVVVHPGSVDTIRVSLTHIAVRLTTMQVRAY